MALDLIIKALSKTARTGTATLGNLTFRCGLGQGGLTNFKREGDGATPIGRWPITKMLYRPDRAQGLIRRPFEAPTVPLRPSDGWCDAVGDRNYNRPIQHPYPASAETMWRSDHLYDVVLILAHNQRPRVQGAGSAIFMHLAKRNDANEIAPTAGCVSFSRRDLLVILSHLGPGSAVHVVA